MNHLLKVSFAAIIIQFVAAQAIDKEIVNKNVDRTIDIASQLIKINYKITVEHSKGKPVSQYVFVVPEEERTQLAFISVKDGSKKELKTSESKSATGGAAFTVNLPSSSNSVVYIETVFTKLLKQVLIESLRKFKEST